MRIPLIAALSWLALGCATQPEAPPAALVAPGASAAESTAPGATAAPAPVQTAQAETVQEAYKAGYKIINEGGEKLYCREQLKTGSNLRKEMICLTEKELEQAREASRRNLEQMQQRLPPPHGT